MTRKNPQVEALEREITLLRKLDEERRRDPGDLPFTGCGDNSCLLTQPRGMATNGGCRCSATEIRRALMWWKRRSRFLEETVRELKDEGPYYDALEKLRRDVMEGNASEAMLQGAEVVLGAKRGR